MSDKALADYNALDNKIGEESDIRQSEVTDLRSDLNAMYDGERTYSKASVLNFEAISTGLLYLARNITVGTTTLSQITTTAGSGTIMAIKIPLTGVAKISYPVWKTSSEASSFIFDDNDVVLWYYYEEVADS